MAIQDGKFDDIEDLLDESYVVTKLSDKQIEDLANKWKSLEKQQKLTASLGNEADKVMELIRTTVETLSEAGEIQSEQQNRIAALEAELVNQGSMLHEDAGFLTIVKNAKYFLFDDTERARFLNELGDDGREVLRAALETYDKASD